MRKNRKNEEENETRVEVEKDMNGNGRNGEGVKDESVKLDVPYKLPRCDTLITARLVTAVFDQLLLLVC